MRNRAKPRPAFLIVREVCTARLLFRGKAIHHLVLVKAAIPVHLVNDKHITLRRIVRQEHIDMVTVHTLSATDIPISVVHLLFPLLAVRISAAAHRALRLLDAHIEAVNPHVPLPVVPSLFLALGR